WSSRSPTSCSAASARTTSPPPGRRAPTSSRGSSSAPASSPSRAHSPPRRSPRPPSALPQATGSAWQGRARDEHEQGNQALGPLQEAEERPEDEEAADPRLAQAEEEAGHRRPEDRLVAACSCTCREQRLRAPRRG